MTSRLNFLVIGAQKSGTTRLHDILRNVHPLELPVGKELPFFSRRDIPITAETYRNFIDKCYPPEGKLKLRGKISPQYMSGLNIARKIYEIEPCCKIVAILRKPEDRLISHYKMNRNRGLESRCLSEAVISQSSVDAIRASFTLPLAIENERHCYVAWSMYGQILQSYYDVFPKKQIKLIPLEAMQHSERQVVESLLEFFECDDITVPDFKESSRFSGAGSRILTGIKLRYRDSLLGRSWRSLPLGFRAALYWSLETRLGDIERNHTSFDNETILSAEATKHLQPLLQADRELLENLSGMRMPW